MGDRGDGVVIIFGEDAMPECGRPYTANVVAHCFLGMASAARVNICHMKLQKLVYFAHGWCLALTGSPLIEESVEAWKYGPVISSIYYRFEEFGNTPIDRVRLAPEAAREVNTIIRKDDSTTALLQRIWEVYGDFNAIELSKMTHLPGTPWLQVREGEQTEKANITIPDELIKQYFREFVKPAPTALTLYHRYWRGLMRCQ